MLKCKKKFKKAIFWAVYGPVLCATPQKSALKSALLTLFRPPTWRSCARCGSTSFRWTSTLASLWSAAPTMTTPGWPSPMTSWSTIRQLETPSWITRCLFKFPKTNLKQFISWTSTSGGQLGCLAPSHISIECVFGGLPGFQVPLKYFWDFYP